LRKYAGFSVLADASANEESTTFIGQHYVPWLAALALGDVERTRVPIKFASP
jgi:hypothetical protein